MKNSWSYVYECFCALVSSFCFDSWKNIIDITQKAILIPPPTFGDTSSTLSACFCVCFNFFFDLCYSKTVICDCLPHHTTDLSGNRAKCLFLVGLHNIVQYGNQINKLMINNSALKLSVFKPESMKPKKVRGLVLRDT